MTLARLIAATSLFITALLFIPARADAAAGKTGAPSAAKVEPTTFDGREAFRLSDGKTEAVVVPSLGRVMSYKLVGGPELLWKPEPQQLRATGYKHFGGDKAWPAPQSHWGLYTGTGGWPPDPTWDPYETKAEVLPGGRLRTVGGVWRGVGTRLTREYGFNAAGEFEIRHTIEKVEGEPRMVSIWTVTQVPHPDATFLPLSPESVYKAGFHWYGKPGAKELAAARVLSPTLLEIKPVEGAYFKVGADAPVTSIAAVRDGVAFVERGDRGEGQYPDGAEGAGLSVQYYNGGGQDGRYCELELVSPLQTYKVGDRHTHAVRWSLHPLPAKDVDSAEVRQAIEALLRTGERPKE